MLLSILLQATEAVKAVSYVPGLAAIAAAVAVIGAAIGIGRIGQSAMEAMARQPEAASKIQSGMIIAGALVEGATLFAIVVCVLAALK
ncbi:MAG: ATP synthase F0 subunit C [Bacteroidales bacterium]|nr:ATP synthase F0 subunit C [Bacteroidales bacterium]